MENNTEKEGGAENMEHNIVFDNNLAGSGNQTRQVQ